MLLNISQARVTQLTVHMERHINTGAGQERWARSIFPILAGA